MITVIHCWSAPRSRSTALLYSFDVRDDCVGVDEPLYREWLIQKGNEVARPYRQSLMNGTPPDGEEDEGCWKRELLSPGERIAEAAKNIGSDGVIFFKHMAKHSFLYDFDNEFQMENVELVHRHLLLIRDPVAVLSAWGKVGGVHGHNPTSDEVGVVPLLAIYSKLESRSNDSSRAVVLESEELVSDPEGTLSTICAHLGIPYKESMLSWSSGPKECDGPWAKVSGSFLCYHMFLVLPDHCYG
jgi:hypothetical protein